MRSRRTFEHYCWPWWCLSTHRRFHITYRKTCRSRADQRAIRSIAADLHGMRDSGQAAAAATDQLRATIRHLAGNPEEAGEK